MSKTSRNHDAIRASFAAAVFAALVTGVSLNAHGAEVSPATASSAAFGWLSQTPDPMGSGLSATRASGVETVADNDGQPLFHVVRLSGGGTVITSSDTGIEPIIAFGPEEMDVSPRSPLYALLMGDMRARRAALGEEAPTTKTGRATTRALTAASAGDGETPEEKWAKLLNESDAASSPAANGGRLIRAVANPVESPTTVTVEPLIGTKWNQGGQDGSKTDPEEREKHPKERSPFSAFTPNNYPAGCVPVVMAQILHYYDSFHDLADAERTAKHIVKVVTGIETNDEHQSLQWDTTKLSRDNLPFRCVEWLPERLSYVNLSEWIETGYAAQINVGRLLADCGALIGVTYTEDGTGGALEYVRDALKEKFGYEGATMSYIGSDSGKITFDSAVSIIKSELDVKRPVAVSLGVSQDPRQTGHSVLADGYGTSGSTTYIHLNMGWAGNCDTWYNLPEVPAGGYEFKVVRKILHDLRPKSAAGGASIPGIPPISLPWSFQVNGATPHNASPQYGFNDSGILVEWRPYSAGATYTISRSEKGKNAYVELTNSAEGTSWTDSSAKAGVEYNYIVSKNNKPATELDIFCGLLGARHVSAPQVEMPAPLATGIQLSWDEVEGATDYYIFRTDPSTNETEAAKAKLNMLTSVKAGTTQYLDSSAKGTGSWYRYRVRAYWEQTGLSDWQELDPVQEFISPATASLEAPVLTASVNTNDGTVRLSWTAVPGASGYQVFCNSAIVKTRTSNAEVSLSQKNGCTCVYHVWAYTGSGSTFAHSPLSNPCEVALSVKIPTIDLADASSTSGGLGDIRGVGITIKNLQYGHDYRIMRMIGSPAGYPTVVNVYRVPSLITTGTKKQDWNVMNGVRYFYYVEADDGTRSEIKSIILSDDGFEVDTPDVVVDQVALDQCGGEGGTEKVSAVRGYQMPTIVVPSLSGYSFSGYFSGKEGTGVQYYSADGVGVRLWDGAYNTLYAAWRKVPAPVTLSSIAISGPAAVASGESATYTCTASYSDGSTAKVSPSWSISSGATYGTIGQDGVFTANVTTTTRSVTIKAEFGGKTATKTVSIMAQPETEKYVITFDANGGTGGTSAAMEYGAALSAPQVSRIGHTFTGWSPTVPSTVPNHDATYVAQWRVNNYTITFNANGGQGGKTVTLGYGAALAAPTVTRKGYTFDGWTPAVPATVPAENKTYTAQWKAKSYTVTLDAQGGTGGTASVRATYGEKLPSITVPALEGVRFDGYWTAPDGEGTQYYGKEGVGLRKWDVDAATTLYAKWIQDGNWYVSAATGDDANDGRSWEKAKATIQAAVAEATDGNVVFVADGRYGPVDSGNKRVVIVSTNGAEKTTIDASLASHAVAVRCATLGGAASETNTVLRGFRLTNGKAETGGGSFGGTLDRCILKGNEATGNGGGARGGVLANCLIAGNVAGEGGGGAYGATLINCTLAGNTAGGVGGGANSGTLANCIVWGNAAQSGNAVQGADCRHSCLDDDIAGEGNIRANPLFKDGAGGDYRLAKGSPCIDVGANDLVAGDADLAGNPRLFSGVVDMGAYETLVDCAITLDAQGGTGGTTNKTATYGAAMPAITPPTQRGYTFGGYWTEPGGPDGGGTQYYGADGRSARNWDGTTAISLYAYWTANTYAVKLNQQSGTGGTTNTTATYGAAMPAITPPTRTGYTFCGYYTSTSGGGTQYYTATGASARDWDKTAATTLYAKWTANTYAVSLDLQSGSDGSASVTATYGAAMPPITVPTRTGYTFGGYYTDADGGGTQYYTASGASARNWNNAAAMTLYAKWKANKYRITFDRQNGTGGSTSATATYGAAMPAITVPRRTDYTFGGYFTEPEGRGVKYYTATGASACDWDKAAETTLYAFWEEIAPLPVWRFYSKAYKGHFFTIDEAEKDNLIANNPNWKFEGEAYRAHTNKVADTVALYRFYSKGYKGHFFTIDEDEMWTIRRTNRNWKYEGIAYYVYPHEVDGSVPVYRFWSKSYRHHFYTIDKAEKANLIATNPNWKFEGEAFWAVSAEEVGAKGGVKTASKSMAVDANDRNGGNDTSVDAGVLSSACSEIGGGVMPWTLVTWPDCEPVVTGGGTEVGGHVIEARAAAPDARELDGSGDEPFRGAFPLLLSLPDGAWCATLWSARDGTIADEDATGVLGFILPANGAWHWLRVREAGDVASPDTADAFSFWLRAK